ncbi:MAG: tRNA (adenosine(37)-N6)-threonylcarbamoyltransferase complex dimerization subunit type 1 TsaB [Candidatus Margulisbacteria bacterium]|nr:tRNA (adenosine(37)-N6)-threonylcarbamoyltransferase complex dimerization subunit type 1 TsaB [Candidatus Margulisiibacteriota bacterium]
MRILGISSATKVISIGLIDEDKALVETTMADLQSERVVHYIEEAGIKPGEIEGVAVASGPGSYSGLRGGLAAAKSLAQSLNVPLVGVPTLDAIAYNLIEIEGTMAVILDARADEYNFALFGASGGKLKRLTDDIVLKLDVIKERLSKISGEIWVVGSLKELRDFREQNGGAGNHHWVEDIHSHPYGINVARLGLEKIKAGQIDDPLKLTPNYSHQPNIREYKS